LKHGTPDEDTFRRVLAIISPDEFQKYLSEAHGIMKEKFQIVNIDGKTMRGSGTATRDPFHVVSAWVDEKSLTLGQVEIDEKSNEITAIPKLLDLIDVKGDVVTIDAMGTQIDIAKKIVEKKADYVLAVKGNQGELHKEIQDYFKTNTLKPAVTTNEKSRDRLEKREYFLCTDSEFINWLGNEKWIGLKAVGKVKSTVTHKGRTITVDRYYITTLTDAEKFAKSVRGHWGIEKMHWLLDVVFGEDKNRSRKDHTPRNLNILRKTALTLLAGLDLRMNRPSMNLKMKAMALDPETYMAQLFA